MAQYSSSYLEFEGVTNMFSAYLERRRAKADPKPVALKEVEPLGPNDLLLDRKDLAILVKQLQGYFLTKAEQDRVTLLIEELSASPIKSITFQR